MSADNTALKTIPPSRVVRDRLADTLREAKLLRALLRVAERAEQERRRRLAEAANAS
jgi:hypothetical protein